MRRGRAAAALAGGGALAALAALLAREPAAPPAAAPPVAAARAEAGAPARAGARPAAAPAPLPASLAGTEVDGGLRLGPDGRFAPGPEALVLFDYFLAASGEEPPEAIRARIVAEIGRRLAPPAAADAEALLERYLAYRAAARELFESDLAHADAERRFQRIRELRRAAFGAGLAAALFGVEEAILAVDLERRRVAGSDLPPGERARRLAALEAELPEAERRARAEMRAALELREAEAALRAAGAGEAAIAAERERRVGPAAAARLADLDRRRAAWDERVAAYRAERDALRARGLAPEREAEALAELRAARFQGPERARIEALERIEARAAGAR